MSQQTYPNLFKPGTIGTLTLPNRMAVAPMTRISATEDGLATDQMADYYVSYVTGGFGLIISEGTYPDTRYSQGYPGQPGIATGAQAAAWTKLVEKVHGAGGKMFVQFMHAGALSQHNEHADETIAPSAIRPEGEMAKNYKGEGPFKEPRAMTVQDIAETIQGFADAARRAVEAGFDGIELHGANGYLLDQFTTPELNRREDDYGGSLENRMRFTREVTAAVVDAAAGAIPVGVRVSQLKVNNRTYQWPDGDAHARAIFSAIADAGATYVHANAAPGPVNVFDTGKTLARLAREYFGGVVVTCGGLADPHVAEGLIAAGDADFIANARASLADPELPKKIAADKAPIEFDMGMTTPLATLDNTANWRKSNLGVAS